MILGEVLSAPDFNKIADFSADDLEAIAQDWEENAPVEYQNILQAD